MKKSHYVLFAMFAISIAAFLFISPLKVISQKKITQSSYSIPDNVAEVLRNSCVSCHESGGNVMAESMWSFSSWDKYSAKKQASKSKAMCNAITSGKMPPSNIRQSNPSRIPTAVQTETICKWAISLKIK
jgi:hypothetical protein